MRRHRLARLSKLTQGAALVSVGTLVACNTNGDTKHVNAPAPTEPIHVNATAEPAPSASAAPSAAAATSGAQTATQPPATSPTAAGSTSTAHALPSLPRINAPPHFGNPPPPPKE